MPTYTEQRFEEHIEQHLNQSGYQWEDILHPDNLIEFINNFIHEQKITEKVYDRRTKAVKDEKRLYSLFVGAGN